MLPRSAYMVVPSKSQICFPQSRGSHQTLLAFKVRFPGDSQSLCQIPKLGSLMWGLEPSQQCENFFGIIVIQCVWVAHPTGLGFHFIVIVPLLPSCCSFSFVLGYWVSFFGGFWRPLVDSFSTVVILVLSQKMMSTCPSALPS